MVVVVRTLYSTFVSLSRQRALRLLRVVIFADGHLDLVVDYVTLLNFFVASFDGLFEHLDHG